MNKYLIEIILIAGFILSLLFLNYFHSSLLLFIPFVLVLPFAVKGYIETKKRLNQALFYVRTRDTFLVILKRLMVIAPLIFLLLTFKDKIEIKENQDNLILVCCLFGLLGALNNSPLNFYSSLQVYENGIRIKSKNLIYWDSIRGISIKNYVITISYNNSSINLPIYQEDIEDANQFLELWKSKLLNDNEELKINNQ